MRDDSANLIIYERLRQNIKPAPVQHFRPKALVCESRNNNQQRRMRETLNCGQDVQPVPVRQVTLANDHAEGAILEKRHSALPSRYGFEFTA
jgi:hypothetical protein